MLFTLPTKRSRRSKRDTTLKNATSTWIWPTATVVCFFFTFICGKECNVPESELRKIIFEVLKQLKIAERLDVSNQFWAQFGMHNQNVKEKLGLYKIENIDNVKVCTIAVNPKEYFEKFEDRNVNKKHKRVKRNTRGMDFECYAGNITPLREADSKKKETKIIQKQLQVHNTEMKLTSVSKVKFTNLNNKRYVLLFGRDCILTLRTSALVKSSRG